MNAGATPFTVTSNMGDDGVMVLRLHGELDMPVAPELERALSGVESCDAVIVDMTELSFMDSSGLRTLLAAADRFRVRAVSWGLAVEPESAVGRLLELSGVDGRLPLHATLAEARASVMREL